MDSEEQIKAQMHKIREKIGLFVKNQIDLDPEFSEACNKLVDDFFKEKYGSESVKKKIGKIIKCALNKNSIVKVEITKCDDNGYEGKYKEHIINSDGKVIYKPLVYENKFYLSHDDFYIWEIDNESEYNAYLTGKLNPIKFLKVNNIREVVKLIDELYKV